MWAIMEVLRIVTAILTMCVFVSKASEPKQYCIQDTFNATCRYNEVIVMEVAIFGRMKSGKCIEGEGNSLGCSKDVRGYFDERCSGKQHCSVNVRDLISAVHSPCRKDFMTYLEASHSCVQDASKASYSSEDPSKVADSPSCPKEGFVSLQKPSSFFSYSYNVIGTKSCPWIITVQPGQNVNLTMFNFQSKDTQHCFQHLRIEENPRTNTINICRATDRRRLKVLDSSTGNKIKVYVQNRGGGEPGESDMSFLFRYDAVGCPDHIVKQRPNTFVQRTGETLMAKCNDTEETWYLTCHDTQWIGEIGNCSQGQHYAPGISHKQKAFLPQGILLAVLIGVVLGVLIGSVMLLTVHCYRRRSRKRRRETLMIKSPQDGGTLKSDEMKLHEQYPALLLDVEHHDRHMCEYTADYGKLGKGGYSVEKDLDEGGVNTYSPTHCQHTCGRMRGEKGLYERPQYPLGMVSPPTVPATYFDTENSENITFIPTNVNIPRTFRKESDGDRK